MLAAWSGAGQARQTVALTDFDWQKPVNLTNHGHWDFDPSYSPDGSKIAFHSNRPPSPDQRGQIYVMNANGTQPTALTQTEGTNYGARWSPDGLRIVFTSERDGDPEVYVMNADGTQPINLTNSPDSYDAGPAWSPDGRFLAYFSGARKPESDAYQPPGSPYRYWNAEIYLLDLETGERTRVTTSDRDDIYPVWSTDGRRLAFVSVRDGNEELYVVGVDGTGERRITRSESNDKAPSWLPGDTHLAFRNDAGPGNEDHSDLYVVELETGVVTRVTEDPDVLYFIGALSPDRNRYVYSAFTKDEHALRGERADVYVVERKRAR